MCWLPTQLVHSLHDRLHQSLGWDSWPVQAVDIMHWALWLQMKVFAAQVTPHRPRTCTHRPRQMCSRQDKCALANALHKLCMSSQLMYTCTCAASCQHKYRRCTRTCCWYMLLWQCCFWQCTRIALGCFAFPVLLPYSKDHQDLDPACSSDRFEDGRNDQRAFWQWWPTDDCSPLCNSNTS